jgi:hypothetical protein
MQADMVTLSYLKVVEMHTWSSDWKRVVIVVIIVIVIIVIIIWHMCRLDDPNDSKDLIRLGYLLAKQPSTRAILREFAKEFLLAEGASAPAATARKA